MIIEAVNSNEEKDVARVCKGKMVYTIHLTPKMINISYDSAFEI